jgi:transposase
VSSLEQEQRSIINELRSENEELKRQLNDFKRLIFGKKNERFVSTDGGQTSLFNTSEADVPTEGTGLKVVTYQRSKSVKDSQKPVRTSLPAHLPREEQIIEPEDKPANAVKIGEAVTEILEYRPGIMYVRKIVRPKYKDADNPNTLETNITIAPLPNLPIPAGNAGASLLAYLFISKYIDHLPYYRQVQMFKREGIKLSESSISGWFKAVCKLLEPLYDELKAQVLASEYVMGDETTIPVQSSNKPGATHTGYMWVYRAPVVNLVMFDYQKSRGGQAPAELLKGYKGALQTDGYAAYDQFEANSDITLIGCLAHARRYFEKALDNNKTVAEYALTEIQKLYAIEKRAQQEELNADEVKDLRQQEAVPILNALHTWMQDQYQQVAPKSSTGKALAYSLKLWKRLMRYTENGLWRIDNNLVENSIRPVALGRKNYLFAGSHDAAKRAAIMYTLFGSCKLNNIEPRSWLTNVLDTIQDVKISELSALIPNDKQKPKS